MGGLGGFRHRWSPGFGAQGLQRFKGESCYEDLKDKDYDRPGCRAASVYR